MDDSVLNLDNLTSKKLVLGGQEYSFTLPPITKLKTLTELQSKLLGVEDPEKIIEIISTELYSLIPEIPKEVYQNLNSPQLKAIIAFLTGGDVADSVIASKKK